MDKNKISILDVCGENEIFNYECKLNFLDHIEIIFFSFTDKILSFFHNLSYGIKNILYYFPVIWEDRQWDFEYYFLELLKYKLRNTHNYFVKNNITSENSICAEEINILLQKIQDYKFVDTKFEEENQHLLIKIKNCTNDFKKNELLKIYFTKAQMYEISLYNDIMNYLKDNCRKWWD